MMVLRQLPRSKSPMHHFNAYEARVSRRIAFYRHGLRERLDEYRSSRPSVYPAKDRPLSPECTFISRAPSTDKFSHTPFSWPGECCAAGGFRTPIALVDRNFTGSLVDHYRNGLKVG